MIVRALLFGWLALPVPGLAASSGDATAIWAHGGRAYVIVRDSSRVAIGARASFHERKKRIAEGLVTTRLEGALHAVSISTGTLDRVKRLDRLTVRLTPPPRPPLLRIGFPSDQRANLVVPCVEAVFTMPVRGDGAWPDSVIAVSYDDAADEEIALERGELDVAVFWPGELTPRMRSDRRWSVGLGVRGHDWISGRWVSSQADTGRILERLDLSHLDESLFRGDLVPWDPRPLPAAGVTRVACRADTAFPGWRSLEAAVSGPIPAGRAAHVALLRRGDSISPPASPDERPLFRIGCTVVCPVALVPHVLAIGVDDFVDRVTCKAPSP